jgi:hypothetical protein
MNVHKNENHIYLEPNSATPFLTGLPFPKGEATRLPKKPAEFDIKHSVTKYEIYVQLSQSKLKAHKNNIELAHVKKHNPSSLMTKILKKIK